MVIKTEVCAFSDTRVYPGHGVRMIRRDGQPITLFSAKCKSLLKQRKKPAKLTWTQAWRRLNKKIKVEEVARRRTRKTTKLNRAIVGASLEEIKKKRSQKPEVRSAQREAAAKEVKARKAANKAAKGTSTAMKAKPMASRQKGGNTMARAGAKR
eukprot:TRINITY_DN11655_c0_g1_i1.p2 TRINITY_DN11655_c0_g1~~TRINITY_DN11655_c0_g1_i1.p2  ORF type:complete len:154 (-),score=32.25 TRINITY_DN11655_c0_g1_i1:414-875(-)